MKVDFDILIVGAGVVGCAMAYALRKSNAEIAWVEAAPKAGMGMTSRNSGVIHAGLYYPARSLKSELCRKGRDLLYSFLTEHEVPHAQPGKYIVAQNDDEIAVLHQLKRQNEEVPLHWVDWLPTEIRAKQALFSPLTGIVDQHALVAALIAASGRDPFCHQKVSEMISLPGAVQVIINGDSYTAAKVYNCAGLQAAGFASGHRHYLARGSYFRLREPKHMQLPALVYPAIPKSSPYLGIHLTQNLAGEFYLGPDLEWIDRETYAVQPDRAEVFFQAAVRYLPWLTKAMLEPGYAGIRAKLDEHKFSDFLIYREGDRGQLCHFLGIESPGLTAALALADYVLGKEAKV